MLKVTRYLISPKRQLGIAVVAIAILACPRASAIAATSPIELADTWSEYDPKFFGAGIQEITNHSSMGYTSTMNGSVADYLERPKVYQHFNGVDVSQVGQKLTASFDVIFHTAPTVGDTTFRFGFGDTTTNQGIIPVMVDMGRTSGMFDEGGATMRMRYDHSITDDANTFTPSDLSGFLSSSGTFGNRDGNPLSPVISDAPGGIEDTTTTHSFTATIERVERNVDTTGDGVGNLIVGGWYTIVGWTSDAAGAETVFVDVNNSAGDALFDADTGLGVYDEDFGARERMNNVDTLGFAIYLNDPFANNSSQGSYTISNVSVEYDDGSLAADFDSDTDVDADDLVAWETNYGLAGSATKSHGDANSDSDVDGSDFLTWQNEHTGPASALVAPSTVPEPTSQMLIIAVIGLITTSYRHQRV